MILTGAQERTNCSQLGERDAFLRALFPPPKFALKRSEWVAVGGGGGGGGEGAAREERDQITPRHPSPSPLLRPVAPLLLLLLFATHWVFQAARRREFTEQMIVKNNRPTKTPPPKKK